MAAAEAGVPVASTAATVSAAGAVTSGPVWSATVMVEVTATAVLPATSTAVKVTKLAPRAKVDAASFSIVTALSTLSVTVAAFRNAATAESVAGVPKASTAATVIAIGALSTGTAWSATVTVLLAVLRLPAASVALKITTVAPSGNWSGASLVRVSAASTLSATDAEARSAAIVVSVAAVPVASTAAIRVLAGAVTTGAV